MGAGFPGRTPERPVTERGEASRSHGPPEGKPWDEPLGQAELAFVDVEATGVDPRQDHIVELCIEVVRGGQTVRRLDTLVNPMARVGGAACVHGLGAAELAGAPRFADIAPQVEQALRGTVFVAHGSYWDATYIEAEMARVARPLLVPFHIDTLTLARRAFGFRSNRLGALAAALGIEQLRAHRASDDVSVLRALFDRLVTELKPSTPRDLWNVRVGQRQPRPDVLQACLGAQGAGPVVIHYRPSGRGVEQFGFVITSVRTDLDPPRVIGYLVPGRGRRDLRSDRIIAVVSTPGSSDSSAAGTR